MKYLCKTLFFITLFTSCNEREKNNSAVKTITEVTQENFKSALRTNENIMLGKVYTDTVKFNNFNDGGDNTLLFIEEEGQDISLICDGNIIYNFVQGNEIEIKWKMDSIRFAGDDETLAYKEFLISARNVKKPIAKETYYQIKRTSLATSCGSGCAMVYNVKDIKQNSKLSIEVNFEVNMYINEKLSETFKDNYVFYYDNYNTLVKISREGETENAVESMVISQKRSFLEFGERLKAIQE